MSDDIPLDAYLLGEAVDAHEAALRLLAEASRDGSADYDGVIKALNAVDHTRQDIVGAASVTVKAWRRRPQ